MVSDVSAVVSDYLRSDKPFAIVSVGTTPEQLLVDAPAAKAAYVLDEDLSNLGAVCDSRRRAPTRWPRHGATPRSTTSATSPSRTPRASWALPGRSSTGSTRPRRGREGPLRRRDVFYSPRRDPRRTPGRAAAGNRRRPDAAVGPQNRSGQATAWAEAVRRGVADADAVSCRLVDDPDPYPADLTLDTTASTDEVTAAAELRRYVGETCTHVLIEAGRGLTGKSVVADANRFRTAGLHVGVVASGSDVRVPSEQAERRRWNPYARFGASGSPVVRSVRRPSGTSSGGSRARCSSRPPDCSRTCRTPPGCPWWSTPAAGRRTDRCWPVSDRWWPSTPTRVPDGRTGSTRCSPSSPPTDSSSTCRSPRSPTPGCRR